MKVILLQRIERLGQMGDVVTVKPGYARNFLLPSGRARRATAANLKGFESERTQLEARNIELKNEGATVGDKLAGQTFVAIRQAGDSGQLYGSVSTRDIADLVTAGGFSVSRGQVVLPRPIKMLGLHPVRVALHPEVSVEVTVNVARSDEEAKRQARGEDVTIEQTDEEIETEIALGELFEDEATAEAAEEALTAAVLEDEESEVSEPVATSPDDAQEAEATEETEDTQSA